MGGVTSNLIVIDLAFCRTRAIADSERKNLEPTLFLNRLLAMMAISSQIRLLVSKSKVNFG